MAASSISGVMYVCSKCKSDEIISKDKENPSFVKCLNCGHEGVLESIWYIRRKTKKGYLVKKFVNERERNYLKGKSPEESLKVRGLK